MRLSSGLRLVLAIALAATASAAGTWAGQADAGTVSRVVAEPAPVASLEPAETEALWQRLVATRSQRARTAAACRPLRGVFYAATDFLRLATRLAANASPCAQYYISIPPIVGNKTQPRPSQAARIRALGPNFHAMAEIHFASWTRWVADTGSSWYTAGITARERMAAAGYDVTKGDIWVVNELTSAVRRGTGNARANVRELLRGLYEGGGRPTKGAVFVIGVGQQTSDVSLYQTTLQTWFADSAFWADMASYVSDWSQEVYGDVRNYAVPGVPEEARRDYLNDYLQHQVVLAGVGPPEIETARSFLLTAHSPLANAAWERETGYGWTKVSSQQMAAYVSGQVHALRYFSASNAQAQDHWGFAWAPRNGSGLSASEFAAQSGAVLDRLAAAVRDSAETADPADPGGAACGPPGQNLFCSVDLEGARLNEAWKSFRSWTQPVLRFGTPAQTVPAGAPSTAMNLRLVTTSGLSVTRPADLAVTLSSSSTAGAFSTSVEGPWSPTITLTIPARTSSSPLFYYRDTIAGSPVLTASAAGVTSGVRPLTVTPGPLVALAIRPALTRVPARSTQELAAAGTDSFGNVFPVIAAWSLLPRELGTLTPAEGSATVFTAGRTLGEVTITATVVSATEPFSATARVTVTPARLRIAAIDYRRRKRALLVTLTAVDVAGKPVPRAAVFILVERDGRTHFTARGSTGASGRKVFRVPARRGGCFTTRIRRVVAQGFAWDGRIPRNRRCLNEPR